MTTGYWFISPKYRANSTLALSAFLLAFVVILLGAYTRLSDAGLSCPDWPHCYGFLTAPHTPSQLAAANIDYPGSPVNIKKAWTEMTHRYAAGTEGILILILSFSVLFTRKAKSFKATSIALLLLLLLGSQVVLGMLTVTEKLKPVIVLSHLLMGIAILNLLWWFYLDLQLKYDFFLSKIKPHILPWLWLALLIVFFQIGLGGWVSSHYAGLACIDFPYCNGQWLPPLQWDKAGSDLITIHMFHRIGAVITFCYLVMLSHALLRYPPLKKIALCLLCLIFIQLTLGIFNILWLRPLWVALMHHATALLLLITLITALVKTHFASREKII